MTYQPGDRVRIKAFDMEFDGTVEVGFDLERRGAHGAVVTSPDNPYYPNQGVMFYGEEIELLWPASVSRRST